MHTSDSVGIAELKAHLSEALRAVEAGKRVTIRAHGRPVADLVPHAGTSSTLRARRATRSVHEVELPPAPKRGVDTLAALAEVGDDRFGP
jgi:prevent-host-death family protein